MTKQQYDARGFLMRHTHGVLSTQFNQDDKTYPFGSLVSYDVHPSGDIIIKTALISEHYKNLSSHPEASVFVIEPSDHTNPQAHARVTYLVHFTECDESVVSEIRKSFLTKFPDAIPAEIEPSFRYWRGVIKKIRWIGGFGSMGWILDSDYYRL